MSNIDKRIAQWEKMAAKAPDDMAFFSLGNAYKDAERWEDAEKSFAKAIELNDGMSRAYQHLGQALLKLEKTDEAEAVLMKGYEVAAGRGDVMPQKAIGQLITAKLGKELPDAEDFAEKKAEVEASGEMVLDKRSGQAQPRLDGPPMRGKTGLYIEAHFGQITWNEWIGQGTKVINELRLDFSKTEHQDIYDQQMLEWLGITKEEIEAYEAPAEAK